VTSPASVETTPLLLSEQLLSGNAPAALLVFHAAKRVCGKTRYVASTVLLDSGAFSG